MTEPSEEGMPEGLTPAEERMWTAFRRGEVCDLRTGYPRLDDPMGGEEWGPDRTVRALVMARLLLSGPPAEPGRVAALKLSGAVVTGLLNLSGGQVRPYVELHDCRFDTELLVPECHFGTVRLIRCALPRIEAARVTTEGDLHLPQCQVRRGIRLSDAHIGTDLLLNRLNVGQDRSGRAIAADGLTVGQDMEAELAEVTGEFSLRSARVGGRLSLRGSRLSNPEGRYALNAARVTVEHTLYLSSGWVSGYSSGGTPPAGVRTQRFVCEGGLRLDDGRFGNALIADQALFRMVEGQQLSLRRIQTPELRLTLDEAPTGRVSLAGARVGNLTDALILGLAMIGIMLAFAVLALQIIVTLLEFKIVTLGGFVLLPFGIWSKSAFLAERPLGFVVSSGLKVLALAIVVSGARSVFDELQPSAAPDLYDACRLTLDGLIAAGLSGNAESTILRAALAKANGQVQP